MRKLLALAVILALLVAGDFAAKAVAESQLAGRVQKAVARNGSASASISSFPFVGRLLASGHVSEVDVGLTNVTVGDLHFASITDHMNDVHVDRDRLVSDRKVVIRSIGSGAVTAQVDESELSRAIGIPITLQKGRARVTVAGVALTASFAIRNNRLVLGGLGSLPLEPLARLAPLVIPRAPLLPCVADVEIQPGALHLACTFSQVPPELIGAANRRLSGG